MQLSFARLSLVIVVSLPLGACSSIFGSNWLARNSQKPQVEQAEPAAAIAHSTDEGRKHLGDGRVGLAIEAFQKALTNGEPVAPALNGLGVAYARLDRPDAAKRFFEQASAMEPGNERFAANLVNLLRSPAFALRQARELSGQLADQAGGAGAIQASPAQASSQPRPGQLQRVSRGEVRIATAPARTAPLPSMRPQLSLGIRPTAGLGRVERGQAPTPSRAQASAGPEAIPAYPIRIEFSGSSRNMRLQDSAITVFAASPKSARPTGARRLPEASAFPGASQQTPKTRYPIRFVL